VWQKKHGLKLLIWIDQQGENIMSHDINYFQHTLNEPFVCFGRGLHTGLAVVMRVLPAEPNTGLTFVRRDLPMGENAIRAIWFNVRDTQLSTTLGNRFGASVSTVEHVLAALKAHGIDNARLVLNAPEVPILEGSARTFSDLILSSGRRVQSARRRVIVVRKPVEVKEGDKLVRLLPSPEATADVEIDFPSAAIGRQRLKGIALDEATFIASLRDARTFAVQRDVEKIMAEGLAQGASLTNAILVDDDKVINPEGLHYKDEFVRHKVLDLYGDLALAGAQIIGHFKGKKIGHGLNARLVAKLLSDTNNFTFTDREFAETYWATINYRNSA
jgi:UDP-3-O-[3-hydroxymyristoyl] N-acetylglucosamine deacetylase